MYHRLVKRTLLMSNDLICWKFVEDRDNAAAGGLVFSSPNKVRSIFDFQIQPYRKNDSVAKFFGMLLLLLTLPLLTLQILIATIWEILDVKIFRLQQLVSYLNENVKFWFHRITIHPEDEFMVNVVIYNGFVFPLYLCYEAWYTLNHGFSWKHVLLYQVLRFGPNVSNFAWVNALTHKCCHSRVFKTKSIDNIFEYWITLFHGIVPGNYAFQHIYNHHKDDNSLKDVITVIDFQRDSVLNFIGYVYRWFVYTLNVSTALYFFNEKQYSRCWKTILCSLYYFSFIALVAYVVGPLFCFMYIFYPLLQVNLIIAAVNYTWHAFVQKDDEQNKLINSTTIVNGQYFIMVCV
uniref:Fatty acid desaturase domain-containing protein n=1 Tax=Aplanochytrium stocchinoi TaxID=215587 RepID=A0A7S3LMV9_9STRA